MFEESEDTDFKLEEKEKEAPSTPSQEDKDIEKYGFPRRILDE